MQIRLLQTLLGASATIAAPLLSFDQKLWLNSRHKADESLDFDANPFGFKIDLDREFGLQVSPNNWNADGDYNWQVKVPIIGLDIGGAGGTPDQMGGHILPMAFSL